MEQSQHLRALVYVLPSTQKRFCFIRLFLLGGGGGGGYLGDPDTPLAADLPPSLDALITPPPGRLAQVVHHRLQQVHEKH